MLPLADLDPASPEAPQQLRSLAIAAAHAGGQVAREGFGTRFDVELKADRSEVTEFDRRAERAVIEAIRNERPQDAFIGEEQTEASVSRAPATANTLYWIIDPIDGTRNFVRGAPLFCCSVAAMHQGMPIAGAIYDPLRNEAFSAAAGEGAFLADQPLKIQPTDRGKFVVAIPSARAPEVRARVEPIIEGHVVRNLGCSTMHLAWIAANRFDATLLNNCKLWDIAAGWLIVKQAGGSMTNLTGGDLFPLDLPNYKGKNLPAIAGSPPAHARILSEIAAT